MYKQLWKKVLWNFIFCQKFISLMEKLKNETQTLLHSHFGWWGKWKEIWCKKKWCYDILSTWHFVNLPFFQLATLSGHNFVTVIFINFVNFPFCQLVILTKSHLFSQLVMLSTCNLIIAILSACHLVNSAFCRLVDLPFSAIAI